MIVKFTRWEYPDHEVKAMVDILNHPAANSVMDQDDRNRMWVSLQHRRDAFIAGVGHYAHDFWVNRELRALDPLLRLRWDFESQTPTVDRLDPFAQCWRPVLHWRAHLGMNLIEYLRECDTWRYTPAQYRKIRQDRAAAVKAANDRRGVEKVLAAVDNMSRTQIERFIEVEEAIATGTQIELHGEDEAVAERHLGRQQAMRRELAESGCSLQEYLRRDQMAAANPWAAPWKPKSARQLEGRTA